MSENWINSNINYVFSDVRNIFNCFFKFSIFFSSSEIFRSFFSRIPAVSGETAKIFGFKPIASEPGTPDLISFKSLWITDNSAVIPSCLSLEFFSILHIQNEKMTIKVMRRISLVLHLMDHKNGSTSICWMINGPFSKVKKSSWVFLIIFFGWR